MSVGFKDILGQEDLKKKLRNAIESKRLAHTLLFSSDDGAAALPMALATAKFLHCQARTTDACGQCSSCKQWQNLAHPDVHFSFPFAKQDGATKVQKSSDLLEEWRSFLGQSAYRSYYSWVQHNAADKKTLLIPKAEADDLFHSIKYKSYLGGYKIGIIWQPEKLHIIASNFLLKMLEEPKDNTLYILVSSKVNNILPTILSRVQHYRFLANDVAETQSFLVEKYAVQEKVAAAVANLSQGSIGKALDYADTLEGKGSFLDDFVQWMRMCFAKDIEAIAVHMESLAQLGREGLKNFLMYCLEQFRKCLWINSGAAKANVFVPSNEQAFFDKFAPFIRLQFLPNYQKAFNQAIEDVNWNGNAKIILTDLSFKIMVLLKKQEQA